MHAVLCFIKFGPFVAKLCVGEVEGSFAAVLPTRSADSVFLQIFCKLVNNMDDIFWKTLDFNSSLQLYYFLYHSKIFMPIRVFIYLSKSVYFGRISFFVFVLFIFKMNGVCVFAELFPLS